MAVVDANNNFLCVDIGTNGRVSDSGIWKDSVLRKAIESGELSLPTPPPPRAPSSTSRV